MKLHRYTIDPRSGWAIASVALMLASSVLRIICYAGEELSPVVFWVYYVNMLVGSALYVPAVFVFGRKLPALTILPVAMGVFFFVIKSLTFGSVVHTVLCVLLYSAVLVLYSLTFLGILPTKYLLYPLFGLPFLEHLIEDIVDLIRYYPGSPEWELLPEASVLCIMAALFCVSVALKKRNADRT